MRPLIFHEIDMIASLLIFNLYFIFKVKSPIAAMMLLINNEEHSKFVFLHVIEQEITT